MVVDLELVVAVALEEEEDDSSVVLLELASLEAESDEEPLYQSATSSLSVLTIFLVLPMNWSHEELSALSVAAGLAFLLWPDLCLI